MIKRLKEMENHFKQLEGDRKPLVLEAIDHLDRLIEDLLLEQEYEGKSDFIREYRKHYSLKEIKKYDRRNRLVSIDSLDDGKIREINPEESKRLAEKYELYKKETKRIDVAHKLWEKS
ncbi:hypothetical protein OIC52_004887 [Salmonella enterica]|nr:hypothetical protein [Salmonella enterica]